MHRHRIHRLARLVWILLLAVPATADIRFEEVTGPAGIRGGGETFGASWGDLDGDGWPDLWVSNHTHPPSLYRNQRDGTFRDVAAEVSSADPTADTHAAAWGDFDGDGDQDLVELVGAIISEDELCVGCGENHLFENEDGTLRERAAALGVEGPVGLGRTPLWLDVDRDGRLDLLAVNQRFGTKAPSTLYRNTEAGFRPLGADSGFVDAGRDLYDEGMALLENLLALRPWWPDFSTQPSRAFAQLADLTGDGSPELLLYTEPNRVFSLASQPMTEITGQLGFPPLGAISDAAIADFDGDGALDLYVTRGRYTTSIVTRKSPTLLKARFGWSRQGFHQSPGITFRSDGPVHFEILYPYWIEPEEVAIGADARHPASMSFTVDPDAGDLRAPAITPETSEPPGFVVGRDPETGRWTFRNATRMSIEMRVRADQPIEELERIGFVPFREEGVDALLLQRDGAFPRAPLAGEAGAPTACHSVVPGDFDNDMDVDLYLVCSGPIENLDNRVLENDGRGRFSLVPGAGGAAGTPLGRGDVAVTADYDRDGHLDLFVVNGSDPGSPFVADAPHQLFHNRGGGGHWLEIDLVGTRSNREGIGASLTLEAGGVVQRRERDGGMHVYGQSHGRVHFGLGPHDRADRLTILWPSGTRQTLSDVAADRVLEVVECEITDADGGCVR